MRLGSARVRRQPMDHSELKGIQKGAVLIRLDGGWEQHRRQLVAVLYGACRQPLLDVSDDLEIDGGAVRLSEVLK